MSEILIAIGGIITLVTSIMIAVIEHQQLTPNKKNFSFVLALGGLLAIGGSYCSSQKNNTQQDTIQNKTDTIILANKAIDSLTKENTSMSHSNSNKLDSSLKRLDSITDFAELQINKLNKVQKELQSKTKEIIEFSKNEAQIQLEENKKLKYPMPTELYVSFQINIILNQNEKLYFVNLMKNHPNVVNPKFVGYKDGVPTEIIISEYFQNQSNFLNPYNMFYKVSLIFIKKDSTDGPGYSSRTNVIHTSSNNLDYYENSSKIQLNYNPKDTLFTLYFNDIKLRNNVYSNPKYQSLFDLKGSDILFAFDEKFGVSNAIINGINIRTEKYQLCTTILESIDQRSYSGKTTRCYVTGDLLR